MWGRDPRTRRRRDLRDGARRFRGGTREFSSLKRAAEDAPRPPGLPTGRFAEQATRVTSRPSTGTGPAKLITKRQKCRHFCQSA